MKHLLRKTYLTIALMLVAILMTGAFVFAGNTAKAAASGDTVQVTVNGTYGQTEARNMLARVNAFRANEGTTNGDQAWWLDPAGSGNRIAVNGLEPLTYDYKLEQYAMQRAAELAVQYSHTRPDGTSSLDPVEVSVNGENIAYGTGLTEEEVFNMWLEADETTFEDQGHRANMLGGYYDNGSQVYTNFLNTIGIGHFEYDGVDFWVQDFGQYPTGAAATDPSDSQEEVSVDVLTSLISGYEMTAGDVSVGYHDTLNLDDVDMQTTCQITNGNLGTKAFAVDSEYSWENLTPEFLSLEGTTLRGEKAGTGRLAVTNSYGKVLNVDVTVAPRDIADAQVSGAKTTFLVGEIIDFINGVKPKVVLDGEELEFGVDFCFDVVNSERTILQQIGKYPSTASFPLYEVGPVEYIFYGMGNYTGTALDRLTVQVNKNTELKLYPNHDTEFSLSYGGEPETVSFYQNYYAYGEFEISVADESVVSVEQVEDEDEVLVTPKSAGTTTFTVTRPEEEGLWTASNAVTFTVTVEKGDIASAEIKGINNAYEYTGSAIKPEPQVYMGDDLLVKGQDYELAYMIDGVQTEQPIGAPGKKTVVTVMITGIGNRCTGTTSTSFTINPVTLDVALDSSYAYRKAGVKPQPAVSRGGKTLTIGEDYELTYGENNELGENKGTVTVTGIGDYSIVGSLTYHFDIVAADLATEEVEVSGAKTSFLTAESIDFINGVKPKVIVGGEELVFGEDFYFDVSNGTRLVAYSVGTTTPITAEFPIYEVGTLEYIFHGKGNYAGTAESRLAVQVNYNSEVEISTNHDTSFSLDYGAEPETVAFIHNYQAYGDYEISVADENVISVEQPQYTEEVLVTPKGAGTTTFTIKLPARNGVWAASNTLTFNVTVKKGDFAGHVTAALVNPDQEYYFTPGTEHKPAVNVYYDKTTKLEEGKDYTLRYEDNMYAGTGKVIVSSADPANYEGEVVVPFEIKPLEAELVMPASEELVFGEEKTISFSGAASKKTPVITMDGDAASAELVEFNDSKGTGTIKIKGTGVGTAVVHFDQEGDNRYTGVSGTINVTVKEAEISAEDIQIIFPGGTSFVYTGNPIEPAVKVTAKGVELTDEFCTVTFTNNVDPGFGEITVTGKNGLVFTKNETFEITLADVSELKGDVAAAKELLDSVPVAANGDDLMESESWIDQEAHDALAGAIQSAEEFLTQDKYTEADVSNAKAAIGGAMDTFRDAVKKGNKKLTKITSKNVTLSATKYVYSGKAKKPSVKVTVDSVALTKGSDFTVTYKNNVKVGKASVVVTGQGNYTGTVTKTFKINPKQATIASAVAGKKQMTVKAKTAVSKAGGTTYQIWYKVKGTSTWKKTTSTKQSKVIKSLKKGKKYQVKIRAIKKVGTTTYFGKWSPIKTTAAIK